MMLARECILLSGELRYVIPEYREEPSFPELQGTATLKFNSEFVAWQRGGATGAQISSILFDGLPQGIYTVKGYAKSNISEATLNEYGVKTMFYGPCDARLHSPTVLCYNTVVFPISLSGAQSQFSLTLALVQRAQSTCNQTPCPATASGFDQSLS